ncbi:MAG: hypothetical protein E6Q97_26025 [Desulfurellales bacterium]|nr:MAG: hypothetical protein E6Q97_26025 [Desulfurellales bacterium]
MSEPVVRTSSQLWSQAVRAAEAESELDAASATAGVAALLRKKEPGYEFSNGRKFDDAKGAYE